VDLVTIGLIAVAAWASLLIVVVALCTVSARADRTSERLFGALAAERLSS
jgi:hypothetical protein